MEIYLFMTVLMSVAAFFAYRSDKRKAIKKQWRIPEASLIALSFLGGSLGAMLAMKVFHHKTKKIKFIILVPFAFIIWTAVGILIAIN